ncbi:MAG: hypothetical protein QF619_08870, partial [Candidatus Binatia bacterium]|nr:hypothetical protein [Candidatus Binatia bacterium]
MSIFKNTYTYEPQADDDDDPFDDDFLMQVNNREAPIDAGNTDDDYSDLAHPRRERTRAPELFKYVDDTQFFQGAAVDDDENFEKLARDLGTSHEVARKYNGGDGAEKVRIKQGVEAALAWEATATGPQRSAQRRAAEKVGDYKLVSNAPKLGLAHDQMGRLTAGEIGGFFHGTAADRKAVAAPLNAALQPWRPAVTVPHAAGDDAGGAGTLSLTPDWDFGKRRGEAGQVEQFAANAFPANAVPMAAAPTPGPSFSSAAP